MIWDARNRLRRVDQDGVAALHFDYDDLDRRIRKAGDNREADPILYVWDELAVLTELREGAGGNEPTTIASYAFGLTRLALKRAGSGDQWFHHDMLGSIADLSDSNGTVVEAKTFTPYGKQETISSSAEGGYNRYGYTGHEYDEETDLTYAKARFYDQDLGIFASADPVLGQFDRPPSLHRFIYGFSNPLSFYDPTGETADEIFDSWLTGIAQEEESTWRETKALAVIGWASVYKLGDMLTYGSAHRISEDTDEYMAGELSTGEYMAEVMGQLAIAGAGTAASIALGAGAIGAVTRVGLTGIGAGIAAGAITGAGETLIQDVINISQGEQEGLSSLETYATSTVMGGAMGGIMAVAAKIDARMANRTNKANPTDIGPPTRKMVPDNIGRSNPKTATPKAKTAKGSQTSPKSQASPEPTKGADRASTRETVLKNIENS